MLKFLPIVVVVLVILGGVIYLRASGSSLSSPIVSNKSSLTEETVNGLESKSGTLEDRIGNLENAVIAISKQVAEINSKVSDLSKPQSSNVNAQVKTLQDNVTSLRADIEALKASPPPSASTLTSMKSPAVYIPLGSGGSSSSNSFTSLDGYEVSLDPADYPGYQNMQLEVIFRLPNLVGKAYARLYNITDSSAVSGEVTTVSGPFALVTSSGFNLPVGRKSYRLQIKSDQGSNVEVQTARIKVNF